MGDKEKQKFINSIISSMPRLLVIPGCLLILYLLNILSLLVLKILIGLFLLFVIIGPLFYKFSYTLQRSTIFLNFVTIPLQPNLKNPSKCGLVGVLNFYLTTNEGIKLGLWHLVPEEFASTSEGEDEDYYRALLENGYDVLIYNHGNAGNRSAPHRIELYEVLRKQFHVIAFDYRSYGDSTNVPPTELGAVSDSMFVFKWARAFTSGNVFVWGHSLGTAISTHMLALASAENIHASGLILESPFNNMTDEIREHPLSSLFRSLPWFTYTVIEPVQENKLLFKTDEHINNVHCSILILHAKDDGIVPFQLGLKLYNSAKENRLTHQGAVQFYPFEASCNYGHKYICRSPELVDIIKTFVTACVDESKRD